MLAELLRGWFLPRLGAPAITKALLLRLGAGFGLESMGT